MNLEQKMGLSTEKRTDLFEFGMAAEKKIK